MNEFRIVATKIIENPDRPARVEVYVNEFSTYFDIQSGDKSPNISFSLRGGNGISLSSGIYTQYLQDNLKTAQLLALGLSQNENADYFVDWLILAGWEIILNK